MKKLLSFLLVLCLMLSLAVPAFAAHSMDNFQKVKAYHNDFTDVPSDHWARNAVATCYEYGLMNGASATTFNLGGNLTVAEALVMAAQVDQIYKTGTTAIQPATEGPWYQTFVDYCVNTGIIKSGTFSDYNAKATRAQMAGIFAHALPDSTFTVLSLCTPPDVTDTTPYSAEITTLYTAGILSGSDDYGTFHPDNSISRAEAAVILSRLALPETRSAKMLLKDLSLTHGVTVAVPQDMLDITDPDTPEQPMFVSVQTEAMAMGLFQQDASFRHTDMGMIKRLFDQMLPSMLEEMFTDGETATIADSVSVKFGDTDAIRYRVNYMSEGVAATMIIYVYVQDDVMGAVYIVANAGDTLLNTMANSVRINGTGVSSTI